MQRLAQGSRGLPWAFGGCWAAVGNTVWVGGVLFQVLKLTEFINFSVKVRTLENRNTDTNTSILTDSLVAQGHLLHPHLRERCVQNPSSHLTCPQGCLALVAESSAGWDGEFLTAS